MPSALLNARLERNGAEEVVSGVSPVLTVHEAQLIQSLRSLFSGVGVPPDVDLYLRSEAQGLKILFLKAGVSAPLTASRLDDRPCDSFSFSMPEPVEVLMECKDQPQVQAFAKVVLQQARELVEAKEREEALMEEIAADWESLDTLREINAEIFTSASVNEGASRLIKRIASHRTGFHSALFLCKGATFECLFGTKESEEQPASIADLGPIRGVLEQRCPIVLNRIPPDSLGVQPAICWSSARSLAGVPILTRDSTRGFLIVWSELECHDIDTSFQHLIEALSNRVSILLECDSLTNAARQTERIQQEMEIASTIQKTLLFGEVPTGVAGFTIAALSKPSQMVDGDFYDFYPQKDGGVDLLIGDVMGKGVAAALLGTAVKNQFTRVILESATASGREDSRPELVVQQVSKSISARLIEVERFVTLCYARLYPQQMRIEYVDCGHTNTIVHRKNCGHSFILEGESLPLGVDEHDQPKQRAITVMPGDTILFYSDGVTENVDREGTLFGLDRLIDCVENWSSCGPEILLQQLCRDSYLHCAGSNFGDDFTAVAVRANLPRPAPTHVRNRNFSCHLDELSPLREWLEEAAQLVGEQGLEEDALNRLHLVCVEAFDNYVIHGSPQTAQFPIRLEALIFPDRIDITLRHEGSEFNPFGAPPPHFDGSTDGGFGLFIMFRSSDEFQYRREDGGVNAINFSILHRKEEECTNAVNHHPGS